MVESALISAAATLVAVGGTVVVAIVGFRSSRSTNQATIKAAEKTNAETVRAARDTNKATIDAAHADVRHTLDITRYGQLADRYSKAIEQLGSTTVDVTIGGIYALERIANDSPEDYLPTVMEVLAACIREHSREPMPRPTPATAPPEPAAPEPATRPDIQAAVTVIGRRDAAHNVRQINLRGVYLPRADLFYANLTDVNLEGANLTHADLHLANLVRADLTGADLTAADLTGANLIRVIGADFTDARLPPDVMVPWGWQRDADSGRLKRADTSPGGATTN